MRTVALLAALAAHVTLLAQAPEAFSYQAVARDAGGDPVANTTVGVQFQLHQSTAGGTVVYAETHSPTTNDLGLFTVEVGNGTPGTGTFAAIDWSAGPYFLEVGLDPAGGSSYTSVGTQQLLSVPYAMHAKTVSGVGAGTLLGAGNLPPGYGNDLSCLSQVATLPIGTLPRSIVVDGGLAYVADDGSEDLRVIDISTPGSPAQIGSLTFPAPGPKYVSVADGHAYLVSGSILYIVDVSNPSAPVTAGTYNTGGFPAAVEAGGDRAYVILEGQPGFPPDPGTPGKLVVLDVSDKSNPTVLGEADLGEFPSSIALDGTYAFVLDAFGQELAVLDVSDPSAPVAVGSVGMGGNPRRVVVRDGLAYVVDQSSKDLKVVDVSTPSAPTIIGTLAGLNDYPGDVAVTGNLAVVTNAFSSSIQVIDVQDPTAPVLAGTLGVGASPEGVAVAGNTAYVVCYGTDELEEIQLSCVNGQQQLVFDPATGELVAVAGWQVVADTLHNDGKFVGIGTASPDTTLHVVGQLKYQDGHQADKRVLVSDGDGTATWEELGAASFFGAGNVPPAYGNDLSCLSQVASLPIGTLPRSIVVDGGLAYVADDGSEDLRVIDISTSGSPAQIGSLTFPAPGPKYVSVADGHAYLVSGSILYIVDVSTPSAPVTAGTYNTGGFPAAVEAAGDRAYVILEGQPGFPPNPGTPGKLVVLDVSDKSNPTVLGEADLGEFPSSIALDGTHAFVLDAFGQELAVLDVSDPSAPVAVGSVGMGGNPRRVVVRDGLAYVVDQSSKDLKVVDVSTPSAPTIIGTLAGLNDYPGDVAVTGNLAVVTNAFSSSIQVIDVQDPTAPVMAGTLGVGASPEGVAVAGNTAYVVCYGTDELEEIQLSCVNGQQQLVFDPATGEFGVADETDPLYSAWDKSSGISITESQVSDLQHFTTADETDPLYSAWDKSSGISITESQVSDLQHFTTADETDPQVGSITTGYLPRWSGTALVTGSLFDNGNVGLGTNAPTRRLQVHDSNDGTIQPAVKIKVNNCGLPCFQPDPTQALTLQNQDGTPGNLVGIGFADNDQDELPSAWFGAQLNNKTQHYGSLVFRTRGSGGFAEHMRITLDGNVGIGTGAPSAKLSVNGTANNSTGSWGVFSDARIKTEQRLFTDGLNVIDRLRPIVFTYNANAPFEAEGEQVGIIAQELEALAPYMVSTTEHGDITDLREVNNQAYVFLLINAVKELKAENDRLKTDNAAQQEQIEANAALLQELKAVLQAEASK